MGKRATDHFADELGRLIKRFHLEYDLTYAEALGTLELTKADLIEDAKELGSSL